MKNILLILTLLFSATLFCQDDSFNKVEFYNAIPAVVEDQIFKIEVLFSPGFAYEKGLSDKTTFYASANTNFGISANNANNFDFYPNAFYPSIDLEYRYYYNLEKRKMNYKNFTNNSGQYIAAKLEAFTLLNNITEVTKYTRAGIGGVWGFQKNGKPLTFNFELGLGFGIQNFTFTNYPESNTKGARLLGLGKLSIGFLIFNKNNKYKKYVKG